MLSSLQHRGSCICQKTLFLSSARTFAGHSKFAKIFRSKGANDVARGALFTKISKQITSAVRFQGPDPSSNQRLASALEAAKQGNVPKDIIQRALSSKEGVVTEEVNFEAVGPNGVSLLIECQSDNTRRTTPAIKHILTKHGAEMQPVGSQAFNFASQGVVVVKGEEEAILDVVLLAGAEEVEGLEAGEVRVVSSREGVGEVRRALVEAKVPIVSVRLTRVPLNTVAIPGGEEEGLVALLEALEEHEDVTGVIHNAEFEEEEEEEGGEEGEGGNKAS